MDQNRSQLEELLNKSSLTEEETNWLSGYIAHADTPELRLLLLEKFSDHLSDSAEKALPPAVSAKMLEEIRLKTIAPVRTPAKTKKLFWVQVAAAASVLVLISVTYFAFRTSPKQIVAMRAVPAKHADVSAPHTSRATIILDDGRQIILDSNNQGMLAKQGDVSIEKTAEGAIAYRGKATEIVYNTLFNPRGSKPVSLTLSDGSTVWLNSESTLRYPTAFTGTERKVEITGEAYFEVEKNPRMPFRVAVAGKGMVEVLGTHFNINSYGDEARTRVTLLEGSVKVSLPEPNTVTESNTVVIQPGQQASYNSKTNAANPILINNRVDLDAVMAWKNGYFNFDHADLYAVTRQLARWYNIQVQYEGKLPSREFGGEIQRDLNLSEVLKVLQKNNIHFLIENNILLVRP